MIGGISSGFVAIEITDKDAVLFAQFRHYQDEFEYLLNEGFFDFVGTAQVFRDGNKVLKGIAVPKMRPKKEKALDKIA